MANTDEISSERRVQAYDYQVSGVLDMRGHKVINLETDLSKYPLEDHQGASKAYVDSQVQYLTTIKDQDADNGVF